MDNTVSVKNILRRSQLPSLEARMFLQHILKVERAWLIAHDTDELSSEIQDKFQKLEQQRLDGMPMAYILGQREFMGYMFKVNENVLIPRPETEHLVEAALSYIKNYFGDTNCKLLDLGTGSGAIAVSIALNAENTDVYASDISEAALQVARENAKNLSAKVNFIHSNWYENIPNSTVFDVIASNPPYIAAGDVHLSQGDVRFEPDIALSDGATGLTALHAIISHAPKFLNKNGVLLVEHGWDQSSDVQQLMLESGFKQVHSLNDLADIARVTIGHI